MSRRDLIILATLLAIFLAPAPATLADGRSAAGHPAIKAWLEAWKTGADDLDSFLTEDVSYRDPFYSASDPQGYRDIVMRALSAFRDLELTADDLILEGDRGALTWTGTGTHNASGRVFDIQGVSILRFRDGKIAAEWRVYDSAQFLRQIGALPDGGDGDGESTSE